MVLVESINLLENFIGYQRKFSNIIGKISRIVLNKMWKKKIIAIRKIFSIYIYKNLDSALKVSLKWTAQIAQPFTVSANRAHDFLA